MALNVLLIFASFAMIWFAAKIIVKNVANLSHVLHLHPFIFSFFVLGMATSLPEFFISISSVIDKEPEISAGTLMGGSIVIFLFIIPFLSIIGNGIVTNHDIKPKTLAFTVFTVFLPFICAFDGTIERKEAMIMILSYALLLYFVERKQNFLQKIEDGFINHQKAEIKDLLKIFFGAIILFVASQILVINVIAIAETFHISTFIISLLLISVGTNLPEVSVAIISTLKKTKSVALGNYLGSAATNTLFLGCITMVGGNFSFSDDKFLSTYLLFALGLILFFLFAKSKKCLSRLEGTILLLLYFVFIFLKIQG